MGINLFTIHNRSPAATRVISTVESGISSSPFISRIRCRHGIVEKLLSVEAFRQEENDRSASSSFFQANGEIAELECSSDSATEARSKLERTGAIRDR